MDLPIVTEYETIETEHGSTTRATKIETRRSFVHDMPSVENYKDNVHLMAPMFRLLKDDSDALKASMEGER